jgi:hypothetical protein
MFIDRLNHEQKTRDKNRYLIATLAMHKGVKISRDVRDAFMNGSRCDRDFYLNNVRPENEADS